MRSSRLLSELRRDTQTDEIIGSSTDVKKDYNASKRKDAACENS